MRVLQPWTDLALLAMASSRVVALRTMQFASADASETCSEVQRMVGEKVTANLDAAVTLLCGGSIDAVITGYKAVVDANVARLVDAHARP